MGLYCIEPPRQLTLSSYKPLIILFIQTHRCTVFTMYHLYVVFNHVFAFESIFDIVIFINKMYYVTAWHQTNLLHNKCSKGTTSIFGEYLQKHNIMQQFILMLPTRDMKGHFNPHNKCECSNKQMISLYIIVFT